MRWIAVLVLPLLVVLPDQGHAQKYKFKYFVEIPPQYYTNPAYHHHYRPSPLPTNARELMEAFQQPKGRRVQIELAPVYGSSSISSNGSDGSRRSVTESKTLSIAARYGWNDSLSVRFATDYGWWEKSGASLGKPDESASASGLSDLHFGLGANYPLSIKSKLLYGFDISLSPSKRREGGKTKDGNVVDGNRFSGGHGFSPYIGWQYKMARNWLFGSRADLKILQDKRVLAPDKEGELKESGKTALALAAIIEKASADYGTFGGELRHEWNEPYSITDEEGRTEYRDSENLLSTTLYWAKSLKNDLTIKPSFTYSTVPDRSRIAGYKYDQYDVMAFQVLIRMDL